MCGKDQGFTFRPKRELKVAKREWPKLKNGCKIVGEGVLEEFAGDRSVGYYLCEAPNDAHIKGREWTFQTRYFALLKSNVGPWLERDTPLPTAATAPDVQGSHSSEGGVK